MNHPNLTADTGVFARHIAELTRTILSERGLFDDSDVETVYECERIMALPGYRQLPFDQQAEVESQRQQILQTWQDGVNIPGTGYIEPHDDRFLRHKLERVKRLWALHKGMPLAAETRI
jgi:hypothetical protein